MKTEEQKEKIRETKKTTQRGMTKLQQTISQKNPKRIIFFRSGKDGEVLRKKKVRKKEEIQRILPNGTRRTKDGNNEKNVFKFMQAFHLSVVSFHDCLPLCLAEAKKHSGMKGTFLPRRKRNSAENGGKELSSDPKRKTG